DSRWFIRQVYARVQSGGWRVGDVDTTVITDAPHLSRYKDQMRRTMSGLLHVAPSAVSVKAKTTEGLPPGRRGIAAHAVVLLKKAQKKSVHSPRSTVHRTR
ncbi:MAG: 2-C-methyl-D-erythritol 2,4-cyclodiphosphate synthase, partial [Candidatus Omnitrophica bacterium]|nr:2-C-methyl-D-erythritol 2,4-cyclodiphosphate synthase [Candidatus Omnitrophota bacterium]